MTGCAIYTGMDTKIMQNFNSKSCKRSCVEKRLNTYMIVFLVLLLAMSVTCVIGSMWYEREMTSHWYVAPLRRMSADLTATYIAYSFMHHFITFVFYVNIIYLIPISLYITIGELFCFVFN